MAQPQLSRPLIFSVLAAIVFLGAFLRFADLNRMDLSADEAASWAAASAPNVSGVIAEQYRLNPGKLAIYELLLHAWIRVFGDGVVAMRSLSAVLGTLALLLGYFVALEITAIDDFRDQLIALISAMLLAASLITIKYSREARMYPLLMALLLLQIWFMMRATREAKVSDLVAVAALTALSLGTHFTAVFVIASEGVWLFHMMLRHRAGRVSKSHHVVGPAISLVIGIVVLLPWFGSNFQSSKVAVQAGALEWISGPGLWEPIAVFNKATGSVAFPVLLVLGAVGAWRMYRHNLSGILFALMWMWLPALALLLISYAVTPVFVERYMLSSFVPFFFFAAAGIAVLSSSYGERIAGSVLLLTIALSVGHILAYRRKPHGAEWSRATAVAAANLKDNDEIAVAPPFAVNVVRYYVSENRRPRIVPLPEASARSASIAVCATQHPSDCDQLRRDYGRVIAGFRGVEVRAR